jgi:hypothetical protein
MLVGHISKREMALKLAFNFWNSSFEMPHKQLKEVRYLPITLKKLERLFTYFSAIICIVFGSNSMNGWVFVL